LHLPLVALVEVAKEAFVHCTTIDIVSFWGYYKSVYTMFGVLHETWGRWYMIIHWIIHDGFDIGGGLLSDCLTSIGC